MCVGRVVRLPIQDREPMRTFYKDIIIVKFDAMTSDLVYTHHGSWVFGQLE